MKTNKSYQKRLRVTRKGKVVARVPGHNHFNAKQSGSKRQKKGLSVGFYATMTATDKSRFL